MRPGPSEPRQIVTLSGRVEYERPVFQCPECRASLAPTDAEMGARPGCRFTRRVRRAVCFAAASASFAGAAAAMAENFGLDISAAQVAVIANEEGERIGATIEERERQWREGERPPERTPDTVVLLADATAVLTRAGEEHKMVNVVRGYDLSARTASPPEPPAGSPEPDPNPSEQKPPRPMLGHSRYAATAREGSAAGGAKSDLAGRVLAVGCRIGAQQAKRVVFVADGCPTLWDICEELYPEAIQIQDFWHVMEYLAKAATAATKTDGAATALRETWAHALKASRLDEVRDALAAARKKVRATAKREVLRKAIDYIEDGRGRMDYAGFAAAGLPIGSGPIEAACKHLVKARYGITGARWSRARTGTILALRVAIANEEWDECWQHPQPKQPHAA